MKDVIRCQRTDAFDGLWVWPRVRVGDRDDAQLAIGQFQCALGVLALRHRKSLS